MLITARWKSLSLGLRLFLSFGAVLALTLLLALYLQARAQGLARLERLINEELPQQVEGLATHLLLRLSPSLAISESLANSFMLEQWVLDGLPETGRPDVAGYLSRTNAQLDTDLSFLAVQSPAGAYYFQYRDGELLQRPLQDPASGDRWYFEFIGSEAPYNLNLDADTFTPSDAFVFLNVRSQASAPNGRPLIVAGAGLNLAQMSRLIEGFSLGETGRAALLNAEGERMIDSESTRLPRPGPALSGEARKRSGIQVEEITRGDAIYLTATRWMPELQRYLVIEVAKNEYVLAAKQRFLSSTGWGFLILLAGLVLLYPLTASLLRPLKRFQRQLKEITLSLDLTRRVTTDDRAELGDLAKQTNELLARLARAMTAVSHNALALDSVADRLAHTAGLSGAKPSGPGLEADQTMAAAVEEMASSVAEITATMEEFSASSTQIADHSQSVVEVANQTLERSRKGSDAMAHLQSQMQDIRRDSEQSLAEIVALGTKSKQINKVMVLINGLAAQTKLIAFNAALEASSAGESGRRFSVVASEIRRLADSVTDSTQEIEEHTEDIQRSISRLVVASEKGAGSIEKGVEVSFTTAEDLEAVLMAARQTSSAAQQISLSTQQQKTASGQVVSALRDIDQAGARNAQSVRHITDISQEMIKMSAELNELVQEFTLPVAPDDTR